MVKSELLNDILFGFVLKYQLVSQAIKQYNIHLFSKTYMKDNQKLIVIQINQNKYKNYVKVKISENYVKVKIRIKTVR